MKINSTGFGLIVQYCNLAHRLDLQKDVQILDIFLTLRDLLLYFFGLFRPAPGDLWCESDTLFICYHHSRCHRLNKRSGEKTGVLTICLNESQ